MSRGVKWCRRLDGRLRPYKKFKMQTRRTAVPARKGRQGLVVAVCVRPSDYSGSIPNRPRALPPPPIQDIAGEGIVTIYTYYMNYRSRARFLNAARPI